jgi:hypothetical protein
MLNAYLFLLSPMKSPVLIALGFFYWDMPDLQVHNHFSA